MTADYGTLENPGKSCWEISLMLPKMKYGKTYYIDPNGGSPADAIEVVCKKSEEEVWTCIPPTVDEIEVEPCDRMSDSLMECQGTPIQYGYGGKAKHQLLSLAIKSYIAMQTVNYDCKGTKSATSAIGWDGTDLPVMETTKSVMKDISVDLQCEEGDMWDTYTVRTRAPLTLPIADIWASSPGLGATIHPGEVCFA